LFWKSPEQVQPMIGVFGGTFDPIHFGHLRPALDVLEGLCLEQIRFIPCGQPPHRQLPVANAVQRLAMVQLAIQDQPGFIADDREIKRAGPSYMVDTLSSLRQEMPDKTFCLIVGMDAFCEFDTWKNWQEIMTLANIVVIHRPNNEFDAGKAGSELNSYLLQNRVGNVAGLESFVSGRILFYPVTQLDISSTQIRDEFKGKKDVHYLMPQKIIEYIQQHRIYQ